MYFTTVFTLKTSSERYFYDVLCNECALVRSQKSLVVDYNIWNFVRTIYYAESNLFSRQVVYL